jgi:hypothetical protein
MARKSAELQNSHSKPSTAGNFVEKEALPAEFFQYRPMMTICYQKTKKAIKLSLSRTMQ